MVIYYRIPLKLLAQNEMEVVKQEESLLLYFFSTTSMKGYGRLVKSTTVAFRMLWLLGIISGLGIVVYQVHSLT